MNLNAGKEAGIKSFNSNTQWNQVIEIIKGISDMDSDTKELFLDVFKSFIVNRDKNKPDL